jgi:precorrin-2 dehydrogenase/sirohydrochlorin ferrochelatase
MVTMAGWPVVLHLAGRSALVVGGGPVAARRAASLLDAGAAVRVVATTLGEGLHTLAADPRAAGPLRLDERPYTPADLDGCAVVVVATDDAALNQRVTQEARARGVLVNRADDPEAGDVSVCAHARHGPILIAVHTGGHSPAAAAAIRRQLSAALDSDWMALLDAVAPYRAQAQAVIADTPVRLRLLQELASNEAMMTLKTRGLDQLRQRCERLLQEAQA